MNGSSSTLRRLELIPSRLRRASAAARRASWGIGDQALSSLTNFVLAAVVARNVNAADFGVFALAFAVYLVCLTVSRAVSTDPLSIRYSAAEGRALRAGAAAATGMAVVIGIAAGAVCGIVGLAVGGTVGSALLVLGAGLLPLLLQDAWRYAFFSAGNGRHAFLNDLGWTVGLAVSLWFVLATNQRSIAVFMAAWATGAGVGALMGAVQARLLPRPDHAVRWWREHADIAPRLAIEGLVLSGAQYLTLFAVTVIAGLAAVGAVRAGQVLMNALHIATYGIQLFAIPEAVRLLPRSAGAVLRLCLFVAAGLTALALAWGAFLLLLPDAAGRALLGDTWTTARNVILPLAIVSAAVGIQAAAVVGLRAMALARRSLQARIVSSALLLSCGVVGALLGGPVGTAWGMATGVSIGAIFWWRQLIVGTSEHAASRVAEGSVP